MDLERILRLDEVIERLKHCEKHLIKGYYFVTIQPDLRDRIIELLKEYKTLKEKQYKELEEKHKMLLEQYDTAHKLITIQQNRISEFESAKMWDKYPDRMNGSR